MLQAHICQKSYIGQEAVREQKHSKALLLPLPPLTCLPLLHQEDEALARTGWALKVVWKQDFLLQGPLFTCDSGEVNCPSKGKKELASSGENRWLISFVQHITDVAFSEVPAISIAITITTVRDNFGAWTQPKAHQIDTFGKWLRCLTMSVM